jgi:hypothetical protein
MRISRVFVTAAIALASAGVIAGCSGNGSTSSQSVMPTNGTQSRVMSHEGTGVAPKYLTMLHFGAGLPAVRPDLGHPKFLAVSDFGSGAVEVLNRSFGLHNTITNGLNGPDGDWYDQAGNLYVANYNGIDVQEYPPNGSSPSFTYTAGLGDPINVTTDEAGNVYVADYNFGGTGFVNEYAQGSNSVMNTCTVGGAPEGIAVGETGAVFLSYNNGGGTANIAEFKHGLAGCHATVLGVALNFAGGMQIDNHKNLVACDQTAGAVDIIAPPYSSVTSSITGFFDPFHVALNKTNTLVFVADVANANVPVDNYPSGSNVTTLGAANGISDPAGVATNPYQH